MFTTANNARHFAAMKCYQFVAQAQSYDEFIEHVGEWWTVQPTVTQEDVTALAYRWFHNAPERVA